MELKMNFRRILFLLATLLIAAPMAMAQDAHGGGSDMGSLGAAIAIGLAVLGGSMGQAKTAAAALEGIGRNPAAQGKIFVPMIIGLALIESLVLYAFVIAFIKIKT
jgi:F-type H+-transporting ATPase subunit c